MEKTYEEVADKAGLTFERKVRYIYYMKTRWSDTEEQKCLDGYAKKWAYRFLVKEEFGASDLDGQDVLDKSIKDLWFLV